MQIYFPTGEISTCCFRKTFITKVNSHVTEIRIFAHYSHCIAELSFQKAKAVSLLHTLCAA